MEPASRPELTDRLHRATSVLAVIVLPLLLMIVAITVNPGWKALLAATESAASAAPSVSDTPAAIPPREPAAVLFFAVDSTVTSADGLTVDNEDIVAWDGQKLRLFFDGSDVGPATAKLSSFCVVHETELLMTFAEAVSLPGIQRPVRPTDVVRFAAVSLGADTIGRWELYFTGSHVGLDQPAEHIDALDQLPDGTLILSTASSFSVPGLEGHDEDLLAFSFKHAGRPTDGSWNLYVDGSDIGWKGQDVDAVCINEPGHLYLSARTAFTPAIGHVRGCDILSFQPLSLGVATTGTYRPALAFDGSQLALDDRNITAIDVGYFLLPE